MMQHRLHALVGLLIGLSLLLVGLAGCGSNNNDSDHEEPDTIPATDAIIATIDPADRAQVQTQYESLSTAQQALADVWQDVWNGEEVRCDREIPPLLSPESIAQFSSPPLSEITTWLRTAAIDLDRTLILWTVECESSRNLPPVEITREGRDTALSAGDALREAHTLLNALP